MKIKIGTFNTQHGLDLMHHRRTQEMRIDLDRVAETVREMDVDICGLNEVRNQTGEGLCNQAQFIGEKLGWYYAFVPAISIRNGTYGNAIVSRYPIKDVQRVPIPSPESCIGTPHQENRVLLMAKLEIGGQEITVFVCHFGLLSPEADAAVEILLEQAAKVETPLFFVGDLNLTPDTPQIQTLRQHLTDTAFLTEDPMLTFTSDAPKEKIDYIFVNEKCRPLAAGIHRVIVSDHFPLWAEVEI